MIFQEPMVSLDPLFPIGDQLGEVVRLLSLIHILPAFSPRIRGHIDEALTFLKWVLYACNIGLIVGAVAVAFHYGIDWAAQFRAHQPWVILFLPLGGVVIVLLLSLIHISVFAIMLRYAMAPYLLADYPDDGAGAAVRRSVEMMRGRKWELFKLYVSFLGWELLGVLLTLLAYLPFLPGILAQVNSVAQFYSVLSSLIPATGLALSLIHI